MTALQRLTQQYLPVIEAELKSVIAQTGANGLEQLHEMLSYHMGWSGSGAGPHATGKRIRPMLTLLCGSAAGGDWQAALPAAAAVELVHNFSLIHDDIEDNSPLRHGRSTLWKIWGVPQAVNSGDAMFTLAHLSILRLARSCSPQTTLQAVGILHNTCLCLTQGQFLDISYEQNRDIRLVDYFFMISGKTAALLSAACELGALSCGAPLPARQAFSRFGRDLGLAFQIQDDILGIWGDVALTGKSTESDLVTGKKTLPVIFGLEKNAQFATLWRAGKIKPEEVPTLAALLDSEGALEFAQVETRRLMTQAMQSLEESAPQGEAAAALLELADMLLQRNS